MNRNKTCINCGIEYVDSTKRNVGKTCSKKCGHEYGAKIRKQNGTYVQTEERKKQQSQILKEKYKNGEMSCSDETKKKLSDLNKEIWKDPEKTNKRKELIKKISLEKYGVEHYTQAQSVIDKNHQTNIEKYGTKHPLQNSEVYKKVAKTRLERGLTYRFENKTMNEWADEKGLSHSWFRQVVNEQGFEAARKLSKTQSDIETIIQNFLINYDINFIYNQYINLENKKYRPDFVLSDFNLIIECDGLFWHSDRIKKNNSYHKNKKEYFKKLGYETLFIRSNEIIEQIEVVKSIILNRLQKSNRIFARKLNLKISKDKSFLKENHLMKNGKGRIYSLTDQDGHILAQMQVKWKDKENKYLEISRFCTKNFTTIVGGFSKLLKFIILCENPNKIITFIDKRYGDGSYLEKLGFSFISESLSFSWTNGKDVWHRMLFPKNSGYEHNLAKIWDCGQARWELDLKKENE